MLASQIPARIPLPFANGGTKNTIPTASQIGITPGAASLTDGFPPLTFTPLAAGGVPPAGADFNGILNAITAVQQWQSAGGSFTFNTAFSTSIGGYPKGATLMSTSGDTNWLSTADNNTTDPDSVAAANWVALDAFGIGAVMGLTNANVTLTPAQYGKNIINLTGALTGNVQIIFPVNMQLCTVANNTTGAFTVTCKTASGTGAEVVQGGQEVFYGDGTNLAQKLGNTPPAGDRSTKVATTAFVAGASAGQFVKLDGETVVFTKTGTAALQVKAGTRLDVAGTPVVFSAATAVFMPVLIAGTDYAIYVCTDGNIRADSSFYAPAGYTIANSRKIGGFHYGLVASGTTVASGSFATTGNGMIWTQADVDKLAGINQYSLWDLKFRPANADPRGMVLIANRVWSDIYFCNTDPATNGTSKYNAAVASGTVLPKIPAEFGGNGTATYANGNWWTFNEIAQANGKRLPREAEFGLASFGVTENQSLGGAASTIPATARQAGYTSKYGLEQASGHIWTWGDDSSYRNDGAAPATTYDLNGGRGQIYMINSVGLIRVMLGGDRSGAATSGSRASHWANYPWASSLFVGLRAFGDHLKLA
jgi:hypothetical protein